MEKKRKARRTEKKVIINKELTSSSLIEAEGECPSELFALSPGGYA